MRRFDEVSEFDVDFDATLDWALDDQQVRVLTLRSASEGMPTDRIMDISGDLIFVPVASPFDGNILVCLHCQDPDSAAFGLRQATQQITILSALGELRVGAAISKSIEINAARRQQADRKKYNSLQEALELGTAVSVSLEKEKSAFVLANELQNYLGVDRVTVIEQLGAKSRILAISGQVSLNRRANVVRHAEHLAKVVLKSNEALWFGGDQETLARPVQNLSLIHI